MHVWFDTGLLVMHNLTYVSNEATNMWVPKPNMREIYVHKCPMYMSKVQGILRAYETLQSLYMLNIRNIYIVY
jgi:hypothetical protein